MPSGGSRTPDRKKSPRERVAAWVALPLTVVAIGLGMVPERPRAETARQMGPPRTPPEWPTTAFKVIHRPPQEWSTQHFSQIVDWLFNDPMSAQDAAWNRFIETHLADAAVQFKNAGFEAPALQIARDFSDGGRLKYVVYLGDFADAAWLDEGVQQGAAGLYEPNDLRRYIAINRSKFYKSGGAPPDPSNRSIQAARLYGTLAHELFHGIQRRYRVDFGYLNFGGSLMSKSVTEGMADAAARKLVTNRFSNRDQLVNSDKEIGAHSYGLGFLTRADPSQTLALDPYYASSFWFHLTERFQQKIGSGLTVLEYLMRQRLPNTPNSQQVLNWLEDALATHEDVEESLHSLYPHFLAELASYKAAGRYPRYASDLVSRAFGTCAEVTLSSAKVKFASHRFDAVNEMGGNCVRLTWDGFLTNQALKVEVIHPDRAIADQINLSVASSSYDGTCWSLVRKHSDPKAPYSCVAEWPKLDEGRFNRSWATVSAKTWELPPDGYGAKGEALFIVTNVARRPSDTKSADGIQIRFSFAHILSHVGGPRAPASAVMQRIGLPADSLAYMRLRQYGINPDPPLEETIGGNPFAATFMPIAIPKGTGPNAIDEARYVVTPSPERPIPLGYTGPLFGAVLDMSPPAAAIGQAGRSPLPLLRLSPAAAAAQLPGLGNAGSLFCPGNEGKPVGQVLRYDEDLLEVRVQTDICTLSLRSGLSVVERLDVTAVLPFGWRYQQPAPRSVVTPGIQYYVDRFHDRLDGRLGGYWPMAGPHRGPVPQPPASGGTGGSRGGSTLGGPPPCDCSCAGFAALQTLSKRRDADAQAEMKAALPCMRQCMLTWARACQAPR